VFSISFLAGAKCSIVIGTATSPNDYEVNRNFRRLRRWPSANGRELELGTYASGLHALSAKRIGGVTFH